MEILVSMQKYIYNYSKQKKKKKKHVRQAYRRTKMIQNCALLEDNQHMIHWYWWWWCNNVVLYIFYLHIHNIKSVQNAIDCVRNSNSLIKQKLQLYKRNSCVASDEISLHFFFFFVYINTFQCSIRCFTSQTTFCS